MPNVEKFKFPDGREVNAEEIAINQANENWNEYLLEDGSTIRLKAVAVKVIRLVGEYDNSGNPVYFINSTNIVSVKSPETLKKKIL